MTRMTIPTVRLGVRLVCAAAMQLEAVFLNTLAGIDHVGFRDGELILSGADGELAFAPMR